MSGALLSKETSLFTVRNSTKQEWSNVQPGRRNHCSKMEFGIARIVLQANHVCSWNIADCTLGADQSNHGKTVLIDNSIKFAASGTGTGLYFSLSQYYDSLAVSNVDALDYFGTFEVRGQLDCYDKVHIVASSPSIDTLTDEYLSDWGCSVHEAFSVFPSVGLNGFQAIAIADGVVAPGTQQFAGGHTGLPYIITRGATPAGCGDGRWDEPLGEECDDGSQNGKPGSACSISCKCLSGKAKGDGSCLVGNNSSTPIGTGTGIGTGITPSGSTLMPPGTASSGNPTGYSNSTSRSVGRYI